MIHYMYILMLYRDEWSVGLASQLTPKGIFDQACERVWYDAGDMSRFMYVFMLYRYEWSVGLASQSMPQGIFDEARERVWYDAGDLKRFIYTRKPGQLPHIILKK